MQQGIKNKGKSFTSISRLENGIRLHENVINMTPLAEQEMPGSGPCAHRHPPPPAQSVSLSPDKGGMLPLSLSGTQCSRILAFVYRFFPAGI